MTPHPRTPPGTNLFRPATLALTLGGLAACGAATVSGPTSTGTTGIVLGGATSGGSTGIGSGTGSPSTTGRSPSASGNGGTSSGGHGASSTGRGTTGGTTTTGSGHGTTGTTGATAGSSTSGGSGATCLNNAQCTTLSAPYCDLDASAPAHDHVCLSSDSQTIGDACMQDSDCNLGETGTQIVCSDQSLCTSGVCHVDGDCPTALPTCGPQFTCIAATTLGDSCSADTDCNGGATQTDLVCASSSSVCIYGCHADTDCLQFCNGDNRCDCTQDGQSDCSSGATCTNSMDCD